MSYRPSPAQAHEQGAHVPYLRAIRAHPLLILAIVVVAVATAIAWETKRTPSYKATTQILVTPVSNEGAYVGLPVITNASADPARALQTANSVLESPLAALNTAKQLRGSWTSKGVQEAVSVQPRGESDILSVTATAPNAVEAAHLANTYSRSALAVYASQLSSEAKSEVAQLQARQKTLPAGENANATQIATQLTALIPVADGRDPNFSLLQEATIPTSASGSSKKLIVALALIVGLLIGVGAAIAIEYLNRRLRDEDEVLSLYPLPVLSRVPPLPRASRDASTFELIPPRVREAFRTLQVQLPRDSHGQGRVVMFTSPSPRDGKTASTINFALVLAAAGLRVILFDFDLRKSDVGARLGVRSDYLDLFRAGATLDELLVDSQSAPNLRVVSSPLRGDEVAPLLEAVGRRLPDLLREARGLADYVIVDTPPLGQVSDALRAARMVDDIVLVTRIGNTDRVELQHTRELLDRMGHTPTGLLLVGDPGAADDVYASYGGKASAAEVGHEDVTDATLSPPFERAAKRSIDRESVVRPAQRG